MKGAFLMGRKPKVLLNDKLKAVEDCLDGVRSIEQVAVTLQVNSSSINDWISKYRQNGPSGLETLPNNTHYSRELKNQAVNEYLEGKTSIREICREYNILSRSVFQRWLKGYNGHEVTLGSHNSKGDKIMTSGRKTTYEDRVEIVSFCIENNDNYQLSAEKFQVSYQQVYLWVNKVKVGGLQALVDRRGKRKDPEDMTETQKLTGQVRLLEAEKKRLEMENGFLKKLKEVERRRIGKTNIQPSKSTTKKPDSQ